MKPKNFFEEIRDGALSSWHKYHILPSIVAAQAALESGYADSSLTKDSKNLFGIKADGICDPEDENEEPYERTHENWDGPAKCYWTTEQDEEGNETNVYSSFRVYESFSESVEDHGNFLNSNERYSKVVKEKDYKVAAQELQKAGYATDVDYADKIINRVEEHELYKWDEKAFGKQGKHLIALGHGDSKAGGRDEGATGIGGVKEADLLENGLYESLQKYAKSSNTNIEFYEQDLVENGEQKKFADYDSVTELHFDSLDDPNTSGGHAILRIDKQPNELDQKFIDMLEDHFGLSRKGGFDNTRTNLGNVNAFTKYDTNYRLLELGFITNQKNLNHIQSNYDEVAKDIIEIISGTPVDPNPVPDPDPDPDPDPTGDSISDIQKWLNNTYDTGLNVDGLFGPLTKEAITRGVQTELNEQYNAGLTVDGNFGTQTKNAFVNVRSGAEGNLTRLIQGQLIALNYDPKGFDGIYGPGLVNAVEKFQSDRELNVDGVTGPKTANTLFNNLKTGEGNGTSSEIKDIQNFLNNNYNTGLKVDSIYGLLTQKAIVKGVQTELNKQYSANLEVDGMFGEQTKNVFVNIASGSEGNLTRMIQAQLIGKRYNPNGFDGIFGPGLKETIKTYQLDHKLIADGVVGKSTASSLFSA